MESTEVLREALVSLRRDNETLRTTTLHANRLLEALEALLRIEPGSDPFPSVFDALRSVFVFEQAMVLAEGERDGLTCIVAEPAAPIGLRWPVAALFRKILAGRVVATFTNADVEEWRPVATPCLAPEQPALYLPIRVRDRRGILVLLQSSGGPGFDRGHVTLAGKFALLASHALAARHADQSEAESRRLRQLTEQLRRSEQRAQRNADLLHEIVDVLPVSLTVQDEAGRFVLVNAAAARDRGCTPEALLGACAPELDARAAATRVRPRELALRGGEAPLTLEEEVAERTLLSTYKPVRIFDETLLLSASLDITDRKRFERELARRANFDQLTGLPNRASIEDQVALALGGAEADRRFALAFIDLDNFKHVNDYYSHAIGDALLVEVARRIRAQVRASDLLARISGDEFVLLIEPVAAREELQAVIGRVLEALKEPFRLEAFEVFTSASIGVSVFPDHGSDYETLRRNADSAMYRAKCCAKGGVAYFDAAMGRALTARMELEQRLRLALREKRFRCVFQPKIDIRSRRVTGFEALLRWSDEEGAVHAPGEFIDLAAELGLMGDITRLVLAEAVSGLAVLDRRFGTGTTMSINVAAKQAVDPVFMDSFAAALLATGCASRLMLELTEEAFVATAPFKTQVLPLLRASGVRLSIDDFGTGYSSLAALADITADEIKVGRSFITAIHQRPRSQSVLKAIESLSGTLGMTVVAEGVETADELAYLRTATSIRIVQGYHFAKPMPAAELAQQASELRGRCTAMDGWRGQAMPRAHAVCT